MTSTKCYNCCMFEAEKRPAYRMVSLHTYIHTQTTTQSAGLGICSLSLVFRANRSVFDNKKRIALSLFFKERIALTTLLKRVTRAIYSCLLFKMSN